MNLYSPLAERFPDQFFPHDPLARYTVARLGGEAAAVVRVKSREELLWMLHWVQISQAPWLILGGGSNVLASDMGFEGAVIINQTKHTQINAQTGEVYAESGVNLSTLARHCMADGLAGLEWGVSVPGTMGGAVVNNAGAHGGDMAGNLTSAEIFNVTTEKIETWNLADFEYGYRHSALKGQHGQFVVISATLALNPQHDPAELNARADSFIEHRKKTQPTGASLGSMFKNPPNDYAGRLIEAAGLKGHQIGGVQISPVHANFFINVGGGTASDYSALIDLARQTVLEKFGVELELEVERIGNWR